MSEEILSAIKIDEEARMQVEEALQKQKDVKVMIDAKKQQLTDEMQQEVDQICQQYQAELMMDIDKHRATSQAKVDKIDTQLNEQVSTKEAQWVDHMVKAIIGK